eukprot:g6745.t1
MGRSKSRKASGAEAAAKDLDRIKRENERDAASNMEKLRWKKGHHLNVSEKQCILRAYYTALSLDRLHRTATRAAAKALMLPPRKVYEIVKSWEKHGEVRARASGSGRPARQGGNDEEDEEEEEEEAEKEEEEKKEENSCDVEDDVDDEEDKEDDGRDAVPNKQSDDGRGGRSMATEGNPRAPPFTGRTSAGGAGAMGSGKRKRGEKSERPRGGGGGAGGNSAGRNGLGRDSRGAKKPDRLDL